MPNIKSHVITNKSNTKQGKKRFRIIPTDEYISERILAESDFPGVNNAVLQQIAITGSVHSIR
jgi:hypothetical protein